MSEGMWRNRRVALAAAVVAGVAAWLAAGVSAAATPIKVAILTDCKGAFGAFYDQDIGGAIAAFSQYAGAKPKNPNKPSAGMTGGSIAGHPITIVGYGCSNDTADLAISETKRLMEQLKADILIGPLSGDEGIAVANYAKAHPTKTFVNGTSGAQDTTLKVRAPNFFRFNGDGAMWNAGLGDLAYRKLGMRKVALISDDYSFAWTSSAGFVADFCAAGGQIVKRVFPPLNTTDYSSFVRQLPPPTEVDGYFSAVGGSGLIPMLKAFEQAYGPLKGSQWLGNGFFTVTGFEELGPRIAGAYAGTLGTVGDLKTAKAVAYQNMVGKWFKQIPPFGGGVPAQASSGFVYNYFNNTWALIKALQAVKGDLSDGQKKLQQALVAVGNAGIPGAYGTITLDKNRQAIQDQYTQQLVLANGKLAVKTVASVPNVDQSFGGTFSTSTPAPGRTFPPCVKKSLPWLGKEKPVVNGVIK